MPIFYKDQTMARVFAAMVALPAVGFLTHLLIYAVPKALDGSFPELIPLSYDYWDRGNMLTSIVLSSFAGVCAACWLLIPKDYPQGHCQNCGYDLSGSMEDVLKTCPECGHLDESYADRGA